MENGKICSNSSTLPKALIFSVNSSSRSPFLIGPFPEMPNISLIAGRKPAAGLLREYTAIPKTNRPTKRTAVINIRKSSAMLIPRLLSSEDAPPEASNFFIRR